MIRAELVSYLMNKTAAGRRPKRGISSEPVLDPMAQQVLPEHMLPESLRTRTPEQLAELERQNLQEWTRRRMPASVAKAGLPTVPAGQELLPTVPAGQEIKEVEELYRRDAPRTYPQSRPAGELMQPGTPATRTSYVPPTLGTQTRAKYLSGAMPTATQEVRMPGAAPPRKPIAMPSVEQLKQTLGRTSAPYTPPTVSSAAEAFHVPWLAPSAAGRGWHARAATPEEMAAAAAGGGPKHIIRGVKPEEFAKLTDAAKHKLYSQQLGLPLTATQAAATPQLASAAPLPHSTAPVPVPAAVPPEARPSYAPPAVGPSGRRMAAPSIGPSGRRISRIPAAAPAAAAAKAQAPKVNQQLANIARKARGGSTAGATAGRAARAIGRGGGRAAWVGPVLASLAALGGGYAAANA